MKRFLSVTGAVFFIAMMLMISALGMTRLEERSVHLDGNLLLTFKETINKDKLYEDIQFLDEQLKPVDVLLTPISGKEVVVIPLYNMEGVKIKLVSKYQNYSISKYTQQAYVGTKENMDKLTQLASNYYGGMKRDLMKQNMDGEAVQESAPKSMDQSGDYSSTNVQVKGIDEADIVKTDGKYIYYLKDGSIVIVKAEAGKMEKMSEIRYDQEGYIPQVLYLDKEKLVVIGSFYGANREITRTIVYDVQDPKNPNILRRMEQDGQYVDSRKNASVLHILTSSYFYTGELLYKDELRSNHPQKISPEKIMIYPCCPSASAVIIASMNLNKSEEAKIHSFVGNQENIYMSKDNLYLSYQERRYYPLIRTMENTKNQRMGIVGDLGSSFSESLKTKIKKFTVNADNIEYQAEASINGWVLNQFSMDEKDGYFRVAYTSDHMDYKNGSSLTVFDSSMKAVGSIDNIAPGERIYSVRFMGDKAYMVTFKTIDPFFVLDLKNPKEPKMLGYLKIPGVSDYLHPYDENTIIGFGRDTISNEKNAAFYLGMKISLFDVSDVNNPIEKDVTIIGDRGTNSPLLQNHKALMYDAKRGLMGFPISVAKVEKQNRRKSAFPEYGEMVFQGAYVYQVTKDKIQWKGQITHFKNFNPYHYSYEEQITRLIYIGDIIYTLSDKMIMSTNVQNMKMISSLSL